LDVPSKLTISEEQYVHYVECINSLNQAWFILQELRKAKSKSAIHAAAFRFALVEYAKPYNSSYGIHKSRKKREAYKLSPPNLLPEDMALHQQILDLRDQVLAHSDLTLKEAVLYLGSYGGRLNFGIASSSIAQFPDIEAVIRLIERTLDVMYAERTRLEEALAASPKTK
jgi:hypothetical protein